MLPILAMNCVEWPSLLTKFRHKKSNIKWKIGSKVIVPTIGLISKVWIQWLNSTRVHNHRVLLDTLNRQYYSKDKRPLITISNHSSCLDDPLMWGSLIPFKWQLNSGRHRWSAAAQEICFTNNLYSMFFAMGKTFPIIRGKGIYQPAMDFALDLLRDGQWLHFFPEGKVVLKDKQMDTINPRLDTDVNVTEDIDQQPKPSYELKWGLSRLLLDYIFDDEIDGRKVEVLPIYHLGMDDVLPTREPYIPRINQKTTFYVREEGPIVLDRNLLLKIMEDISSLSSKERRIKIMRFFESEMNTLKAKAIQLHNDIENIVSIKQN